MLRSVAPALCVLVVVAVFAGGRGDSSQATTASDSAPWPADVVAPAPERSAGELQTEVQGRVVAAFRSVDAMWRETFARVGARWVSPTLRFTDDLQRPCAGAMPVYFAGMYCPRERTIYMNVNGLYADVVTQDGALYVLAHEFGHHVQALRGALATRSASSIELNAQCLAGVWGKASGRPAPSAASYPADNDRIHGTPMVQREWLERGYAHARPHDCDEVLG
jgi:predicted metalloprotease